MKRLLAILSILTALAVLLTNCSRDISLPTKSEDRISIEPEMFSLPYDYTLTQLYEESVLGVVGRVVKHENVPYGKEELGHHINHATIVIEEVLFGDAPNGKRIVVRDSGLIVETGQEATAWGDPLMRKGHRVMLFLQENTNYLTDESFAPYITTQYELGKWFGDENGLFYPSMTFSTLPDDGFKYLNFVNNDPRTIEDVRKELSLDTPSS